MAQAARKAFEKEREKILKDLPQSIKDMFGTVGFAPDDEDDENADVVRPILVMNPYDVPPKPVRDVYWFDLYSKAKRTKKLGKLAYLVYHYGADDPDDCYSFLEHDEFISYEDGRAKGYDVLPTHLQSKLDAGETLTEDEQTKVRGIQELTEDAPKPPSERRRGILFEERWEKLVTEPPVNKKQKKKK